MFITFPTFYRVCHGVVIFRDRFFIYKNELYLATKIGVKTPSKDLLLPAAFVSLLPGYTFNSSRQFRNSFGSDLVNMHLATELNPSSAELSEYIDDIRKVAPTPRIESNVGYIDLAERVLVRATGGKLNVVYPLYRNTGKSGKAVPTNHYISEHCFCTEPGTVSGFITNPCIFSRMAFESLEKADTDEIAVTRSSGTRFGEHTVVGHPTDAPKRARI